MGNPGNAHRNKSLGDMTNTAEKHAESQQLQKVFTDFLHKAVHDLKNPLTSIALTSELLKRKANDTQTIIRLAAQLEKASERVFSNLEQLKSVLPLENNSFKLEIQEINAEALLTDIQHHFHKSKITVENRLNTHFHADYQRLKEAISQLIDHISSGTNADVRIKSYVEDKAVVFELSGKAGYNINDVSLAIAKMLIAMHKGNLNTDKNEETHYISLPLTTS